MAAALNPQLTAMLTALGGVQPGLGDEFMAHVGTTMALAAAMPPDWFPKTVCPVSIGHTHTHRKIPRNGRQTAVSSV